jgi:hypothetical protein
LSIWCSAEHNARPFGAERIARVVGPALQIWFEQRLLRDSDEITALPRRTPVLQRRLRIK